MTAAIHRSPGHLSVPLTQNTAPVYEYNCLYSHDIRRKQKRWQDGFLKYHTFNKRIMVYDVPRNLIGSMHWLGEEAVQEGDELRLEKGNALVQVADKIGQSETDLTGVKKSKTLVSEGPDMLLPERAGLRHNQPLSGVGARHSVPLKHKSLNAVLGTPRGPIGKAALPMKSPFEQRRAEPENEQWSEGRPAKRQRLLHASAQPAEKFTTTAVAIDPENATLKARGKIPGAKNGRPQIRTNNSSGNHGKCQIIDLCDEAEVGDTVDTTLFSDDFFSLSSPSKSPEKIHLQRRDSSPSTDRAQPQKRLRAARAPHLPRPESREQSDRVICCRIDSAMLDQTTRENSSPELQSTRLAEGARLPSPLGKKTKLQLLRLPVTAPKRKTLLCQEQIKANPKPKLALSAEQASSPHGTAEDQDHRGSRTQIFGGTLSQRLHRIDRKNGSTSKHFLEAPKWGHIEDNDSTDDDLSDDYGDLLDMTQYPRIDGDSAQEPTIQPLSAPPSPREVRPQPSLRNEPHKSSAHGGNNGSDLPIQNGSTTKAPCNSAAHGDMPGPIARPDSAVAAAADEPRPGPHPALFQPPIARRLQPTCPSHVQTARSAAAAVVPSRPLHAPSPHPIPTKGPGPPPAASGAWSREAFDLFAWRPPNWDEERWCLTAVEFTRTE